MCLGTQSATSIIMNYEPLTTKTTFNGHEYEITLSGTADEIVVKRDGEHFFKGEWVQGGMIEITDYNRIFDDIEDEEDLLSCCDNALLRAIHHCQETGE